MRAEMQQSWGFSCRSRFEPVKRSLRVHVEMQMLSPGFREIAERIPAGYSQPLRLAFHNARGVSPAQ